MVSTNEVQDNEERVTDNFFTNSPNVLPCLVFVAAASPIDPVILLIDEVV